MKLGSVPTLVRCGLTCFILIIISINTLPAWDWGEMLASRTTGSNWTRRHTEFPAAMRHVFFPPTLSFFFWFLFFVFLYAALATAREESGLDLSKHFREFHLLLACSTGLLFLDRVEG